MISSSVLTLVLCGAALMCALITDRETSTPERAIRGLLRAIFLLLLSNALENVK